MAILYLPVIVCLIASLRYSQHLLFAAFSCCWNTVQYFQNLSLLETEPPLTLEDEAIRVGVGVGGLDLADLSSLNFAGIVSGASQSSVILRTD
ncbi:hypothetical protein BT96DRAFT_1009999 [Gymnopus androsaceus JB14]|uniref:Uncharacterized protein n=1 Tax=Gymnopus androsaceus JB14 TaxID=1447944 RepID=A0A6A4GBD3_9AGAR|nr:hypothetical protein BT96DRAFT_1009999 [Gymnopus androsaceus JB14]